jgi:hypothetical protein
VAETPHFWLSSYCPAFPSLPSPIPPTVSLSNPYHCILSAKSYKAERLSISEINISQSFTSLNTITETFFVLGSRCRKEIALDGAGFTQK